MPNNRGGIPMYNENPQYSATISSQLPQGSPAMFGTQVAKEMAGMGDAIGKWGTNLVKLALEQQEKEDNANVVRLDNELRKQMNDLLYNPQTGLQNQKGHNAKGTTMVFDEELDKATQNALQNLPPALQVKLQERIAGWSMGYRSSTAQHEGNEIFSANKTDIDTGIQDRVDSALRAPSAASARVLYQSLRQSVDDVMGLLGMSREAAEEYVQEKYSAGVLQIANALSGRDDTQGLLDLQKATEGMLSADAAGKIAALTGKTQSRISGVEMAKSFLNDPKYKNPDGTYNYALIQRDYAAKYGIGATRTERVWVGGGGSINTIDGLMAAISGQESGGNYDAQNGRTGAYGKYQIMPGNWPSWSEEAGLGSNAERTPENQEKVARYKLNQYLQQYGAEGAMVAWYSGPGNAERWVNGETTDVYGRSWDAKNGNGDEPSIREYVQQVSARGGSSSPNVDLSDIPMQNFEDTGLAKTNNTLKAQFRSLYDWAVQKFGKKVEISGGWRSEENNRANNGAKNSHHLYGEALDVNVEMLTAEERNEFIAEAQRRGFNKGGDDFYHNKGSGYHVHLVYEDDGSGGAGHWEERTVSAYNEAAYNEGLKYIKEQCEASSAEHDMVLQQALNDGLAKAKSLQTPSEVQSLAESYGLNATDTTRLYRQFMSNRVDLANRDFLEAEEKRAQAKGREAFYAWWNANPNASANDISTAAADSNVGPEFLHSLNASLARAKQKGEKTWFQDDQCKAAFNNALAEAGNKGKQKTYAMLRLNELEAKLAEKGEKLTPGKITEAIAGMNLEQVWRKGIIFDDKDTLIDYAPGTSPVETGVPLERDEVGRAYIDIDDSAIEE